MTRPITEAEFALLAGLVKELSGMELDDGKRYLLETRLGPLISRLGCESYASLYRMARDETSGSVRAHIVDAVATHETSFFRDRKPFDLMKGKLVPELLGQDAARPVSIWSAACSTGQEAYSVAMTLAEILPDPSHRVSILGTDISESAVNTAGKGEYSAFEMARGLTDALRERWFVERAGRWQAKPELRARVEFRRGNLLEPGDIGPFDIVLCRNVAIYFASGERRRIFDHIADRLNPGGVLLIGSTETLLGVAERFRRHEWQGASYYRLV